jgi:hypothetical protein
MNIPNQDRCAPAAILIAAEDIIIIRSGAMKKTHKKDTDNFPLSEHNPALNTQN